VLASLATIQANVTPGEDWTQVRSIIETALVNQPRSQQVRIGPSEIGTSCDRCLIHKLAGTIATETGVPWLPFVGTAVHAALENIFAQANAGIPVRWLIETTISVGSIGGVDITGHADLFDLHTGTVMDWKIVGKTTLDKARRHGPSQTYRVQGHLYGRGFTRRDLQVHTVRILFLPRNAMSLADAVIWEEPYDEQIALAALGRADMFAAAIAAMGADAVLAMAGEHTGDEFACRTYDDFPAVAGITADAFLGIG